MDAITPFIQYLKTERRYSNHTLAAYQNDLEQFASYLRDTYEISELKPVKHPFIRSWLVSMMDSGMNTRSINRKITALKSFYRYALRQKWVDENPMLKISSPKTVKRLPDYVEAEKLNVLLDEATPDQADSFPVLRDKMVIELLFGTGMRRAELLGLTMEDVNVRQQTLKVTGKRNKQRIVPIHPVLFSLMQAYMKQRQAQNPHTNQFIILDNGKEAYPGFIYRLVKKELSKVSLKKKKSPHVLRHSFATEMLNNGADLNAIKEILGHASLSATQVYTHNTIEKLKGAFKKAHPRA